MTTIQAHSEPMTPTYALNGDDPPIPKAHISRWTYLVAPRTMNTIPISIPHSYTLTGHPI